MWVALERMFSSQSRARIIQIHIQLSSIQKEDTSIVYFNKVKSLTNTLAAVGKPLSEEKIIIHLLTGLDADYPLVTSITTRTEPISLNDVYAHVLSYEMCLAQQDGAFPSPSANFTT